MPTQGGIKKASVAKRKKVVPKAATVLAASASHNRASVIKKPNRSIINQSFPGLTIKLVKVYKYFISPEQNNFRYSLGNVVASSFSGFIAGILAASLIWILIINVLLLD